MTEYEPKKHEGRCSKRTAESFVRYSLVFYEHIQDGSLFSRVIVHEGHIASLNKTSDQGVQRRYTTLYTDVVTRPVNDEPDFCTERRLYGHKRWDMSRVKGE